MIKYKIYNSTHNPENEVTIKFMDIDKNFYINKHTKQLRLVGYEFINTDKYEELGINTNRQEF